MSNERLAMLFFDFGLVLAMIAMVIGPFEITNWALTAGVVACFFAIASISLAFLSWDERDEQERNETEEKKPPQAPDDPLSK